MGADYFEMAADAARDAFDRRSQKRAAGLLHWSHFDSPHEALCGARIATEDFANPPTCPFCLTALNAMLAEDLG